MEKRVTFKGLWLPLLLVLPQIVITAIFFFYPAGQAVWQSLFIPDPFGLSMQYVGLGNFEYLFGDPYYRASFVTTAVLSILVTLVSMGVALYLAVLADRLIKTNPLATRLDGCLKGLGKSTGVIVWQSVRFEVAFLAPNTCKFEAI